MLLLDFSIIRFGNAVIFLKLSKKCRNRVTRKFRQFIDNSAFRHWRVFIGFFRNSYGSIYGQIYVQTPRKVTDSVTGILSINRECLDSRRRIFSFIDILSITSLTAGR